MADVFDINSSGTWAYAAVASTILKTPTPSLARAENGVKFAKGPNIKPRHSSAYWAKATPGFDFSDADQVPPAQFNKMLWVGLMGRKPYPVPGQSQTEGLQRFHPGAGSLVAFVFRSRCGRRAAILMCMEKVLLSGFEKRRLIRRMHFQAKA